jgi:ubiquinone/menaquinone biosynthesis C-methylase UbiE
MTARTSWPGSRSRRHRIQRFGIPAGVQLAYWREGVRRQRLLEWLGVDKRTGAAPSGRGGGIWERPLEVVRRTPSLRARLQKTFWKLVYGLASRGTAELDTAFLNYGYAEPGDDRDEASGNRDGDRFGIQLYERVTSGVDLTGKDVLEIGCGRGGGTAHLFETRRPRTMTGLDLARSAISRCRRDHTRPKLTFLRGDAEALPFAGASFDVVVNVESSHCYPDVPRFLGEVHRVLRPGGYLLLADVRSSDTGTDDATLLQHADVKQLLSELEASHFAVLEQEDITPNVVRALQLDSPRRRESVAKRVPKALQQQALIFSAVEGSPLYESLASGEGTYLRFLLQKSRHTHSEDASVTHRALPLDSVDSARMIWESGSSIGLRRR